MPDSVSSSIVQSLNALKHNALVIDARGFILLANPHWDTYNQLYGFSSAADCQGLSVLELLRDRLADPEGLLKLEQVLRDIFEGVRLASGTELDVLTMNKGRRIVGLDIFPLITEQAAAHQSAILTLRDIGPAPSAEEPPVPIQVVRDAGCIHLHKSVQRLVPICAACKSVRSIQEEWISIERFLQTQLSLQFTHDICPDCIRELYPKYAATLKW